MIPGISAASTAGSAKPSTPRLTPQSGPLLQHRLNRPSGVDSASGHGATVLPHADSSANIALLEALLARSRTRRDELIRVLVWRQTALLTNR